MSTNFPLRRGLAMLELVLALPILLFIMALIFNYGIVAKWKVDENSVARLAVWETRWPRSGSTNPRPSYWPATASMEASDQGTVAGMDDGRVDLPVARGPLPGANVNSQVLDETSGLREGSAEMTQRFPLLAKLGSYTILAQTWLIDDKWQYQRMGLGDNGERRIPVLYGLAKAPPSLVSAYVQSVLAITQAGLQARLAPLDKDPDFLYYSALFGWGGARDFQPRFRPMCTIDRKVTDKSVQDLIDHIQGNRAKRRRVPSVAEEMARAFLGLYQRALGAFEAIVEANRLYQRELSKGSPGMKAQPPFPPALVSLAQSQVPQLKAKIKVLQKFLEKIEGSAQ
jgi:hypothetical protein